MKNMTDAEKKAWGEKMRLAREKKAGNPVQAPTDNADVSELNARVLELEKLLHAQTLQQMGAQINNQGALVGTHEKYSTDKKGYPDPTQRLAQETRLKRFAFSDNYDLRFEAGISSYTTLDGVRTAEPKFTLTLIQRLFDEDTGEPTGKVFDRCQMIFHEDPEAALVIARDNGISVNEDSEQAFLNEMRYLRMRDWLVECFYPAPVKRASDKKQMVIGNRLVEVYEISAENPQSIPFDTLKAKL